jgi:hypothetical protein
MLLDIMIHMQLYGMGALNELSPKATWSSPINYFSIDANVMLRQINDIFDQSVAAMRIQDRTKRTLAIQTIYDKLGTDSAAVRNQKGGVSLLFDRPGRSEMIGNIMKGLLMPAIDKAIDGEDDSNTRLTLIQLAAAIAEYRATHKHFPAKLEELASTTVNLPVDLYHANPLVYKHIDDGYLLYSTGMNGTDDGGSNEQMNIFEGRELDGVDPEADDILRARIPAGADDISIHLPVSPFKIQMPAAPESATAQ